MPDWFNPVNEQDRYILADDLDKWDKANNRTELRHHYIFGFNLHPDANRQLKQIKISKTAAGMLTFWGATGVARS